MFGQDWLHTGCEEVSKCSTRGESQGMYITFASAKVKKAEPTLALNPRGDVARNPKQGTSGLKKGHVCQPKTSKKKIGYSGQLQENYWSNTLAKNF